jgi:hypothetical protein
MAITQKQHKKPTYLSINKQEKIYHKNQQQNWFNKKKKKKRRKTESAGRKFSLFIFPPLLLTLIRCFNLILLHFLLFLVLLLRLEQIYEMNITDLSSKLKAELS